jgi:HlyD family secretion protein
MPDALQLPVQALAESKGHFFSLVKHGDDYETREVEIGSTNDKVATIHKGLAEGDEVVMNPRSTGGLLKLPDFPDAPPLAMNDAKPADQPLASAGGQLHAASATPDDLIAQFLKSDANRDDKLSREEISKMEARVKERLLAADANGDGFLERRELLKVSAHAVQRMTE